MDRAMLALAALLPSPADLLRASWQGALLIALVWGLCRGARRLSPASRALLWWGASLKLLIDLVGLPAVAIPILPAAKPAPAVERAALPAVPLASAPASRLAEPPPVRPRPFPWQAALLGAWGAGLAVQAARMGRELGKLARLRSRAVPVDEPAVAALFAGLCRRLGLRRPPRLLVLGEIASPQVMGLWSPAVLLPVRLLAGPPADLEMALCHELVHLRRRDLWLGWVPAVAERLFFFHPLAALAAREYALAREAACDARVLEVLGTAPQAYGRLLLKLGVAPRAAGFAAAGASPSFVTLKRRLEMLQPSSDAPRRSRAWLWLAAPVALLALVPIQMVRADDPKGAVAAAGHSLGTIAVPGVGPVHLAYWGQTAPMAPTAPTAPMAPRAPKAPRPAAFSGKVDDDGDAFVLTRANGSTTMRGTSKDLAAARRLRQEWGSEVLLFTHDGKTYAVRDAATLAKAQSYFAPQEELGRQQGALGEKQGALGAQQGELGAQQGKLGAKVGALSTQLASRSMKGENTDKLEAEIEALSQKMEELGKQQEALGAQQEKLGAEQEKLGEQQEKLAGEAEKKLDALIDQALAAGLAQEVKS